MFSPPFLVRARFLISLADAAAARGVNVRRAERVALVSAFACDRRRGVDQRADRVHRPRVLHLVRLFVGSDHRLVLPASALFGAVFLIGCDLVARAAFAPIELPVGIITAVIGGPFFLWLLVKSSR